VPPASDRPERWTLSRAGIGVILPRGAASPRSRMEIATSARGASRQEVVISTGGTVQIAHGPPFKKDSYKSIRK
jgi:hypothetical protein